MSPGAVRPPRSLPPPIDATALAFISLHTCHFILFIINNAAVPQIFPAIIMHRYSQHYSADNLWIQKTVLIGLCWVLLCFLIRFIGTSCGFFSDRNVSQRRYLKLKLKTCTATLPVVLKGWRTIFMAWGIPKSTTRGCVLASDLFLAPILLVKRLLLTSILLMMYLCWSCMVLVLENEGIRISVWRATQIKLQAFGDSINSYLYSVTMLNLSTHFSTLDPASTQPQGVSAISAG